MLRRLSALAAAGVLGLAAGACASETSADDSASLEVVAAFYPLEFVADRVGGDQVAVTNLAPPGAEPHDLELSPGQVADIGQADLVIFLGSFQPAVDEAVSQNAADGGFDVLDVVPLLGVTAPDEHGHGEEEGEDGEDADEPAGGMDPHVWLDPQRVATIAQELAAELGTLDPDRAADYTANAEALGGDLAALDTEYEEGLAGCERQEIVVSHAAFGYLTDRYGLEQIAITGLSPEDEPSPQQIEEAAQEAEEHGATTIFFEVLVSPDVAQLIADQVGAQTAVLDPIEGLAPDADDDYFSLMRNNLDALRAALGCS
jgi:zinc transport system substrate-binding protein